MLCVCDLHAVLGREWDACSWLTIMFDDVLLWIACRIVVASLSCRSPLAVQWCDRWCAVAVRIVRNTPVYHSVT